MNYIFIINPHSGSGNKAEKLVRLIKEHSAISYKIEFTKYAGHASEIAKKAVADGVDVVVAVGGDGTINEIAASLVNSDTILGIIPTGSGNGFARSLKIPLDSMEAVKLLNNPHIKKIDTGKINEKFFVGICGVGFDALVGAKFQEFGKRGPLPYFYIGVKEYFKYDYDHFEVEIDGNIVKYNPLLITIANTSQYGNGAVIAPQADPADGYLDFCVIEKMKYSEIIKNIIYLFKGNINSGNLYSFKRIKSLIIYPFNRNGYYHVDGEPFVNEEKLEVNIVPDSLNVCVAK